MNPQPTFLPEVFNVWKSSQSLQRIGALIQKAAPHWTGDREKLKTYLVQNAPKPNGAH